MRHFLRPECGRDNRWAPTLGPFPEYVQLTYDLLTVGPEGDTVGGRGPDGDWHFEEFIRGANGRDVPMPVAKDESFGLKGRPWYQLGWSDVVIWAEA